MGTAVYASVSSVIDCFHCINFMRNISLVYTIELKEKLSTQDYNGLTVAKKYSKQEKLHHQGNHLQILYLDGNFLQDYTKQKVL